MTTIKEEIEKPEVNKEKIDTVFTMFNKGDKPIICSVCDNEIRKRFFILGEKFNQDKKYNVFGEMYKPVCIPCVKKILL